MRYLGAMLGPPLLLLVACHSDSGTFGPADDAGPPGESGGPNPPPPADAGPPPKAVGDPCRGVPLPADQVYVPQGFCANLVASNVSSLRQLTFAPNGDLFGVTTSGSIRLFHDDDGDGFFQPNEIHVYGNTGGNGNNCHIDAAGGYLYAGTPDGVMRWPYSPTAQTGGDGEAVVVGQPIGGHSLHTTHVYDGYLYVHSGSAGNATNPSSPDYDQDRSLLRRFPLASFTSGTPFQWSSGEVVSVGLRNMAGYTQNAAGRMYGVVNGLDDISYQGTNVHNDNPGEQLVALGMGKQFGYPFCFTAQRVVVNNVLVAPAGTQLVNEQFGVHDDQWCAANSTPPATFFQAHSAPLDIRFFDTQPQGVLPDRMRGGAFVALHGSWDRAPATGYKVIWMPFDANGNPPMPTSTDTTTTFPYETVFGGGAVATGPADGPWSWASDGYGEAPRPVGVAISPIDGALYISSDSGGSLYRIGLRQN